MVKNRNKISPKNYSRHPRKARSFSIARRRPGRSLTDSTKNIKLKRKSMGRASRSPLRSKNDKTAKNGSRFKLQNSKSVSKYQK